MQRILIIAFILFVCACSKKNNENGNPPLPASLQKTYNNSTHCSSEGCNPYIQLITYQSSNYFALAYDSGPLCDLSIAPLPIYDENGEEIDIDSELYKDVSTKGQRGDRIWECKKT